MGTVGGAEGVVHVYVGQSSQLLGEACIVLLFFSKEANVFKQNHVAVGHRTHLGFGVGANAAVGFGDGFAEQLAQACGHRCEAHRVVHLTLGATKVSREHNLGALANEVVDGGQRCANAGVIGDGTGIIKGNVEVNPHEDAFAAQVASIEAGQGTLRHRVVSCGKKSSRD